MSWKILCCHELRLAKLTIHGSCSFVFDIFVHNGKKSVQDFNNVHLYTWRESKASKDSNIISSAVNHPLPTPLAELKSILSGSFLIHASATTRTGPWWAWFCLTSLAVVQLANWRLSTTFQCAASYLPAVFGRLEQDILKAGQILLPSEYIDIMKWFGV